MCNSRLLSIKIILIITMLVQLTISYKFAYRVFRSNVNKFDHDKVLFSSESNSIDTIDSSVISFDTNLLKAMKIRPSLDDIERISYGQAAKRRGTGSRAVPHRLNELERKEWNLAKKRRYLLLRGTGWRKERGDSPLANIYRNYCDSVCIPCVYVKRGVQYGEQLLDELVVDFSPLRTANIHAIRLDCLERIKSQGSVTEVLDSSESSNQDWIHDNKFLTENAIWRVPFFGITAKFNCRKTCKDTAEIIATAYCEGIPRKHSLLIDNVNNDEDDEIV